MPKQQTKVLNDRINYSVYFFIKTSYFYWSNFHLTFDLWIWSYTLLFHWSKSHCTALKSYYDFHLYSAYNRQRDFWLTPCRDDGIQFKHLAQCLWPRHLLRQGDISRYWCAKYLSYKGLQQRFMAYDIYTPTITCYMYRREIHLNSPSDCYHVWNRVI